MTDHAKEKTAYEKRIASIVLSICLCFTLLPTAALAGETTPTTGVYFSQQDGSPSGDPNTAEDRSGFGADGNVTLTGYWDIPYTAGTALTVYYYNAAAKELTARNNSHIQIEKVGDTDHLWGITLSSGASENEEWVDLNYTLEDGGGSFVMTFKRTASVPAEGLYYRHLIEDRKNDLIDEKGAFIKLDKLEMAPFVDRIDIALYYHDGKDGSDYTPVNRVRLPFGSGFDMVWVRDWMRDDALPAHWYYLSAYDFSESKLHYYTGENYAAPDATPTGSIELNSHQLPETAFYADSTTSLTSPKDAEDIYRMYTVMDWNTDASKPYKYTTTLYLRATDAAFTFGEVIGLTDKCVQRHYDKNGMENAENPETEYKDYIVYTKQIEKGKALEVTIYANDTDLLWLYGPKGDDQYVAYVNLLAPENTQLHLNDQGFEAAKYLPHHLFRQLANKNLPVTLSAGAYAADITCNAVLTTAIANSTGSATLEISNVTDKLSQGEKDAIKDANASAEVQGAVDITLAYGGKTQHKLDGTATVSYPCELNLADGETVLVYYVYTENGEEKTERIETVYDATEKCVTFSTTHFSRFVIATVPTSGTSGSGSSSTPTYSVTTPTAANGTVKVSPKNASKGTTVTITVTPDEGYILDSLTVTDKNGNALELKDLGNGKYSFKMPKGKVNVEATFVEDTEPLPSFADVPANAYYYDAVLWAAKNGVTGGVDENHFAPNEPCSRAQLVTFLWRAAGQPEASGTSGMTDVSQNAYYADAVAWAFENGIVGGYGNGLFGSDDTITREQMAVILYRFAQHTGMDTTQGGMSVREYKDYGSIFDYAVTAIQWAVNAGVMQGYDGNLMPGQPCTRAQIVTMLYRLLGTN